MNNESDWMSTMIRNQGLAAAHNDNDILLEFHSNLEHLSTEIYNLEDYALFFEEHLINCDEFTRLIAYRTGYTNLIDFSNVYSLRFNINPVLSWIANDLYVRIHLGYLSLRFLTNILHNGDRSKDVI